MKRFIFAMLLSIMLCSTAYASNSLDSLSDSTVSSETDAVTNNNSSGSESGSALSGYLKDYNPITNDNMTQASKLTSGVVSLLGTVTGAIILLASAGIAFTTAVDLLCIGVPAIGYFLTGGQQGGQGQSQMGGMQGGYGGYGRGGMGGMGMQQPMQGQAPQGGFRSWLGSVVSNEAKQAMALSAVIQGGGAGMQGGMSGGMYGGQMMGGQMGGQQQPQSVKSVIFEYLKGRSFFVIIFAVAAVVLTSSVLWGCGINIAELVMKIIAKLSGEIANVQV